MLQEIDRRGTMVSNLRFVVEDETSIKVSLDQFINYVKIARYVPHCEIIHILV